MKKLLFFSSFSIIVACHTSSESVNSEKGIQGDSITATIDSTGIKETVSNDTVRAINHGSQEQEKIDSLKREKQKKKK